MTNKTEKAQKPAKKKKKAGSRKKPAAGSIEKKIKAANKELEAARDDLAAKERKLAELKDKDAEEKRFKSDEAVYEGILETIVKDSNTDDDKNFLPPANKKIKEALGNKKSNVDDMIKESSKAIGEKEDGIGRLMKDRDKYSTELAAALKKRDGARFALMEIGGKRNELGAARSNAAKHKQFYEGAMKEKKYPRAYLFLTALEDELRGIKDIEEFAGNADVGKLLRGDRDAAGAHAALRKKLSDKEAELGTARRELEGMKRGWLGDRLKALDA